MILSKEVFTEMFFLQHLTTFKQSKSFPELNRVQRCMTAGIEKAELPEIALRLHHLPSFASSCLRFAKELATRSVNYVRVK